MSVWRAYYDATRDSPPRETLVRALDAFAAAGLTPGLAVDLGCGVGNDTLELLRRGWRVVATDAEEVALTLLAERVPPEAAARLERRHATFRTFAFPRAQLVNASYSLPFCPAPDFPDLWTRLTDALEPGGRFAGHFFGTRDDWAGATPGASRTREEVEALFGGFELEELNEQEFDGQTAVGEPKHWHIFEVVARRS